MFKPLLLLAVAGRYQCTAVPLAADEASTETMNDASAGETLCLLPNICGVNRSFLCAAQGLMFCRVGKQDGSTNLLL